MARARSLASACCFLLLVLSFQGVQGAVNSSALLPTPTASNKTTTLLPVPAPSTANKTSTANQTLPATQCLGYTDPVNLQAKLAVAKLGEVITICSDIVVNKTLTITRAVTLQGNSTGKPFKLIGSLDLVEGYLQIVNVADLVGPVVFQDLELTYGQGSYEGGAVLIGTSAVVSFVRITFSNNVAEYGGAVYSNGNVTFTGCAFLNNTANADGGAIYLDSGSGGTTLTVLASIFYASTAGGSGGAVFLYSSYSYTQLTDNVFVESSSTKAGGAVSMPYNANATITYNDFINGTSATGGGAVSINGIAVFAANNFMGNQAPRGGAVYTYQSQNTSFCGYDNFTSNAAQVTGLGDNVYVEYTPDGSATSFCPLVPVGVVNAQAPSNGYSNASCANCDPTLLCDKNATGVLTSTGVSCTCNRGFYGPGYACYPVGLNVTYANLTYALLAVANLTNNETNATASNATAAALNSTSIALNSTLVNTSSIGADYVVPSINGVSVMMGPSVALAVTAVAMTIASLF